MQSILPHVGYNFGSLPHATYSVQNIKVFVTGRGIRNGCKAFSFAHLLDNRLTDGSPKPFYPFLLEAK
jgi:hypothetical protein